MILKNKSTKMTPKFDSFSFANIHDIRVYQNLLTPNCNSEAERRKKHLEKNVVFSGMPFGTSVEFCLLTEKSNYLVTAILFPVHMQ